MKTIKKIIDFFTKKDSGQAPLVIIKKNADDADVKEYNSIEEAIVDLENDPNVPREKIEKIRSSLKKLKNTTSIKIKNGEIIKVVANDNK